MTGNMTRGMDSQKTRAVVLGGFLGAGKTTLLKRMLSWKEDLSDTVVIVNDFGKVGIDGELLRDAGSDMVELSSGCICCTLRIDLERTLEWIYSWGAMAEEVEPSPRRPLRLSDSRLLTSVS